MTLTDSPDYDNVLIPGIPNDTMLWATIPATEILDEETKTFVEHSANTIYRAGFSLLEVDLGPYSAGDILPIGMIETYRIISHRNKILRDSGVNLPVPAQSDSETEQECLSRLSKAADATPGNGHMYYYPAASVAYAYEPAIKSNEVLSNKFKLHKWFLPVPGDIMRFGQAYAAGWFDNIKLYGWPTNKNDVMTTGQFDSKGALRVNITTGQLYAQAAGSNGSKAVQARPVYPMVQF